MTSDHDALLRAICENPREDTPRLAFADWLEEHGRPDRAAFIRTDIALSLRDEWDADRLRWEERKHDHPGFESGPTHRPPDGRPGWVEAGCGEVNPRFRRGFPWGVLVRDLGRFRERAAELFANRPIEYLAFRANLPQLDRFVAEPWFPRLTGFQWATGRYSSPSLRPLLEARPSHLTELAADALGFNPDGLRALVESPLFSNLTRFGVVSRGSQVARVALESLARPPASCRLHSLSIRGDGLNHDLLLLACSLPESLRVLDVSGSRITAAAAREFAAARGVSGLRMLTVSGNRLGNDGGAALFTSPHLAGLKVLAAQYCQVGDDALRALLDNSPLADGLNLLDLTGSPASGDMKEAVKDRMGDRVRI